MRSSFVAAALLLVPVSASAQAPAPGTPTEYTLSVSPEDLATIGQALGKMSYDAVAQLMGKLSQQVQQQQMAARKAAAPPAPAPVIPVPGGGPKPKLPPEGAPK
jgi:hypothetical protein